MSIETEDVSELPKRESLIDKMLKMEFDRHRSAGMSHAVMVR